MKNLFFLLVLLFVTPTVASANYIYGASVDSDDPCCIKIQIWNNTSSTINFTVNVDGVTYDQDSPEYNGRYIIHCVNINGIYTVSINVPGWGSPYTKDVTIDGCGVDDDKCCNFTLGNPSFYTLPPPFDSCLVILTVPGTSFITDCDITTSWDIDGDGVADGTGSPFFATFSSPGPHTVCVTRSSASSPDCPPITKCIVVNAPRCKPCCGFKLTEPSYMVAPWDPCQVWLRPDTVAYDGECINHTFTWDIDGDGTIEHTGRNFFPTFSGPGPHKVCLTMSYGDCSVTECVMVDLPNCTEFTGGGTGKGTLRSNSVDMELWEAEMNKAASDAALELFPNPATNELNVKLSNMNIERIQVINLTGQIVKTVEVNNTNALAIDISTLATGVYMVRTISNDGTTQTTKQFVKTK